MLTFTTHNFFFFTRKEFWFYEEGLAKEGTYNVFSASKKIYGTKAQLIQKYTTTLINLSRSEEELFNAMHPACRYDIRSAEKQGFKCIYFLKPAERECEMLIRSYNAFAKERGLRPYSRKWMLALQKTGSLYFTKIVHNEDTVVTHIYITDNKKVILANSFNEPGFSNNRMRSEANKLLHWKDIQLFKSMNLVSYDFGGINPEKLPGVSKFKLNFGGYVEDNYRFIKTPPLIFLLVNLYKRFAA